jgi:hypothetical protein
LKRGNLDKFESHSSDGILPGYTPHGRSYRVFNLETKTVVESCYVTFDKTAPCHRDSFEYAGDKEMEESIFVHEELQGSTGMKMNHYFHLHQHSSLFLLPHLKQRLLRLLPLPQQQCRHHELRGRSSPSREFLVIPGFYAKTKYS